MILAAPRSSRSIYRLNERAFQRPLSAEAEYWAGFLFADGNLYARPTKAALTLCLAKKDRTHLMAFRSFMESTHPVAARYGGYSSRSCLAISIGSRVVVEQLRTLGMTCGQKPRRVASGLLAHSPHFWRGVVDGDGSLCRHRSGRVLLQVSGHAPLLQQFLDFVGSKFPISNRILRDGSCRRLSFGGETARRVARLLYAVDGPALLRKKVRALQLLVGGPL